jgi:hypothetical protein
MGRIDGWLSLDRPIPRPVTPHVRFLMQEGLVRRASNRLSPARTGSTFESPGGGFMRLGLVV